MDQTAKSIVECLQQNPRATNREVAGTLGLTEPTVANRINQMLEKSEIRVVAQKHMFSDGYRFMYILCINTSASPIQKIEKSIAKFDGVLALMQGVGNPDLVLTARARTTREINDLTKEIACLRGVSSIESVLCSVIHKYVANTADLTVAEYGPRVSDDSDLEERMLEVFNRDARQSNREVGRQVGVSETAIRHRLNKLLKSGELQFEVISHYTVAGTRVMAQARVSTAPRYTDEIIEKLVRYDEVGFAAETTGQYNLLLYLKAASNYELGDFCNNVLQAIRGVESLDVQVFVSFGKHQFNLAYFEPASVIPKRK